MKTIISVLAMTLLFTGLTACGKGGSDPKAVAEKFWEASKSGDPTQMEPYVTKASMQADLMKEKAGKTEGSFELGEAKVEGEQAKVATKLNDKGMSFDLQTILVKEGGAWKVDVNQTMMSMLSGDAMQAMMKGLGEAGKALGEGMGKAMGEGLKGLGEGLEEAMKGIGQPSAPEGTGLAKAEATETPQSFQVGSKVQVEWHGKWWPAEVIETGQNKWKIHYDGYSNSWDEWVGPERIK